jgi:uncharacterized membrane protein
MKDRLSLLDYLTVAVFGIQTAFALFIGFKGPTTPMPMHWNAQWQVDRWGDRVEFAVFFGGLTLIGFLVSAGMSLAAMRAAAQGDASRRRSMRIGQGLTLFTVAAISLTIAWATLGHATVDSGPAVMTGSLSLILLVAGAFVGRVAPNPLIGVRTPWSYKSRLAWDRSNRLAGRLFCLVGLAGLIAAPFASQPHGVMALTTAVLIVAAVCVFESWRVWRADPDRQPF